MWFYVLRPISATKLYTCFSSLGHMGCQQSLCRQSTVCMSHLYSPGHCEKHFAQSPLQRQGWLYETASVNIIFLAVSYSLLFINIMKQHQLLLFLFHASTKRHRLSFLSFWTSIKQTISKGQPILSEWPWLQQQMT